MALQADELRKRQMACILLWMAGGPSQFETFDPKPGTDQRRRDQGDRDGRPRHQDRRGLGADRQGHEGHRPDPVDDQQGRATTSGRPTSSTPATSPTATVKHPNIGCVGGRRAGRPQVRPAAHRQHRRRRRSARASWASALEPFVVQNPSKPPDNTAAPGRRRPVPAPARPARTGSRRRASSSAGGARPGPGPPRPLPPDGRHGPLAPA